jgi:hypothetical protein
MCLPIQPRLRKIALGRDQPDIFVGERIIQPARLAALTKWGTCTLLARSVATHRLLLPVIAVSEVDARLEAEQCRPGRQIYADGRNITIRPGDVVIDVGANVGRWGQ